MPWAIVAFAAVIKFWSVTTPCRGITWALLPPPRRLDRSWSRTGKGSGTDVEKHSLSQCPFSGHPFVASLSDPQSNPCQRNPADLMQPQPHDSKKIVISRLGVQNPRTPGIPGERGWHDQWQIHASDVIAVISRKFVSPYQSIQKIKQQGLKSLGMLMTNTAVADSAAEFTMPSTEGWKNRQAHATYR